MKFLALFLLVGCSIHSYYSDSKLDIIKKNGVLRLGTTGDYAPFSFVDERGEYSGIDIEIAKALAYELRVDLKIVPTSWPTLSDDLLNDSFDIALSGISQTEARISIGHMTPPYLANGKMAIARCKDKEKFKSIKDINKKSTRLIVNPGGTNHKFALKNLKEANLRIYNDNTKIFNEIIQNRADIMVTDLVEALYQAKKHPKVLCPTLGKPLTDGAITSFSPFDREWNSFLTKWFTDYKETSQFKNLIRKYL